LAIDRAYKEMGVIVWYMKERKGQYCKCQFKNWDYVNFALLTLYWAASEEAFNFSMSSKKQFDRIAKGKVLIEALVTIIGESEVCGSYTTVWK
jgi:hypothetical protein